MSMWRGRLAGMMLVVLVVLPLHAQEIHALKFTRFNGWLGLGWEGVSEEESAEGAVYRSYDERFFKTGIGLNLRGYTYHPNLLEFTIDASLVNNRSRITEFSDATLYNSNDNTYDIRLFLLQKKPVRGEIFFSSAYESAGRAFLGRYYNRNRRQGFRLQSRMADIPVDLEVYHTESSYASLTFDQREESGDHVVLKSRWEPNRYDTANMEFRSLDYVDAVYGIQYNSIQFSGLWRHRFRTERPANFHASVRYYDVSGSTNQTTTSLTLDADKNLKWHFRVRGEIFANRTKSAGFGYDQVVGQIGLYHQLYESLSSAVLLQQRRESGDFRDLDSFSHSWQINYSKRIPTGRIGLTMIQRYDDQQNRGNGELTTGYLEASFTADSIVVSAAGVDPQTVSVTSVDLSRVYVQGVDYDLITVPDGVIVTRIPGGNIPAGAEVRISYLFAQQPDFDLAVHDYEDSVSIRFLKYFRVGYRVRASRNRLISDFTVAPYEAYISRRRSWGMDSRFLSYVETREDYDGTRSVYQSDSWQGTARVSLWDRYRLSYTISRNETRFFSLDHFIVLENKYASFSWIGWMGISGDVNYRDLYYETETYVRRRRSILARFQWQIRKLLLMGSYEYILDDTDASRRKHSYYIMNVRRRF